MEIGWPEAKTMASVLINTSQDNKDIKDSETLFNSRFYNVFLGASKAFDGQIKQIQNKESTNTDTNTETNTDTNTTKRSTDREAGSDFTLCACAANLRGCF